MKLYKKNLKKLIQNKVYYPEHEHDACGVGFVASTDAKKSRKVVEFGIQALKAVWQDCDFWCFGLNTAELSVFFGVFRGLPRAGLPAGGHGSFHHCQEDLVQSLVSFLTFDDSKRPGNGFKGAEPALFWFVAKAISRWSHIRQGHAG